MGISENIPYNLWLIMFMVEHSYLIRDDVLYEDIQSEILMIKNGRNSCRESPDMSTSGIFLKKIELIKER